MRAWHARVITCFSGESHVRIGAVMGSRASAPHAFLHKLHAPSRPSGRSEHDDVGSLGLCLFFCCGGPSIRCSRWRGTPIRARFRLGQSLHSRQVTSDRSGVGPCLAWAEACRMCPPRMVKSPTRSIAPVRSNWGSCRAVCSPGALDRLKPRTAKAAGMQAQRHHAPWPERAPCLPEVGDLATSNKRKNNQARP